MLKPDLSCEPLTALVQQYHLIIRSTHPSSEERKQAGVIYAKIKNYVQSYSEKALNLNKLAPQTLHFLEARGLKFKTKRAGAIKLKKKKKRRGPRSWDYRQI